MIGVLQHYRVAVLSTHSSVAERPDPVLAAYQSLAKGESFHMQFSVKIRLYITLYFCC